MNHNLRKFITGIICWLAVFALTTWLSRHGVETTTRVTANADGSTVTMDYMVVHYGAYISTFMLMLLGTLSLATMGDHKLN